MNHLPLAQAAEAIAGAIAANQNRSALLGFSIFSYGLGLGFLVSSASSKLEQDAEGTPLSEASKQQMFAGFFTLFTGVTAHIASTGR